MTMNVGYILATAMTSTELHGIRDSKLKPRLLCVLATVVLSGCEALIPTGGEIPSTHLGREFVLTEDAARTRAFRQSDGVTFLSFYTEMCFEEQRQLIDNNLQNGAWERFTGEFLNSWIEYENTLGDSSKAIFKTVWTTSDGRLFSYNIESDSTKRSPPFLVLMWSVPVDQRYLLALPRLARSN